ncbi:MAG: beta-ketoacyl synthase N-terminal-like domain-containing protein [Pirellulaceae bacterium]
MNSPFRECIVVTGLGVVSPIGWDLQQFWNNLQSPNKIQHDGTAQFSGHIDDFGPLAKDTKRLIRKSIKLMNRETQLGVAAAQHAITNSGLLNADYQPDRIGVCFGAGNVEIRRSDFQAGVEACQDLMLQFDPALWGQLGVPHVDPLWILRVLPNMPACHAAIANDLRGPNNTITQATVASCMAFAEARNAILDGDADAMIVGGTGTNLLETLQSGIQPIASPAEGAAAFVIERRQRAIERGAVIYGEILGASSATAIDTDHRARPSEAIAGVIDNAICQSGLDPILIHSIQTNRDATEFDAISGRIGEPPINSIIDRTGDAAAGSSALSIAATLLAIHHGENKTSATINIDAMDNGLASCVVFANSQVPATARDAA